MNTPVASQPMTADLVARLEIAAKIHDDMTGKGNAMAATIREAASALRGSGEAVGFHRIRVVDWNEIAMAMPLGDDPYAKGYQDAMDAVTKCLNLHPATPANAWRPIAEAGEESHWGSPVLLHNPAWNMRVLVGGWDAHEQAWRVYGYGLPAAQPTHFQPLPTPPTSTKA